MYGSARLETDASVGFALIRFPLTIHEPVKKVVFGFPLADSLGLRRALEHDYGD